jgi:hypothetical protein
MRRYKQLICKLIWLLMVLALCPVVSGATRQAAVYTSDGKVVTGQIALTAGRRFKLNCPEAGKLKTTDMITGADVQYGKVRQFTLEPIQEMSFHPEREEIRQDWKFTETTRYDEKTAVADFTPAQKKFWGETYPLRYLSTEVVFSSGETLSGHLYSCVLYLKTPEKNSRIILRSKQRGPKGSKMDDLVYVTKIKLLDEGTLAVSDLTVVFEDMTLAPTDVVQALTRDSLTPVPTVRGEHPETFVVKATFGEDIYLAVRQGEDCLVGWPEKQDPALFALARDHLKRQRDFYNDKQLLGVMTARNGREVLTLVNLRRRFAPTHFGEIGGEWDKTLGTIVEPWRLSIWRWKYDSVNQELLLSSRGTFFRRVFLPEHPTPQVQMSDALWQMRRQGNTIHSGKQERN